MPNPIDLKGQKFGRLTAVEIYSTGGKRGRKWHCICDCGGSAIVEAGNLKSGNSTSCKQCRYRNAKGHPKHGHRQSDTNTSPTYRTWRSMKRRLKGRGHHATYSALDMDPRWAEFDAFLADMGERPEGTTLDRINNEIGYWKHNCRWATSTEQTRNRRIALLFEKDGRSLPIAEWAKELGISYQVAYDRIRRRGTPEL